MITVVKRSIINLSGGKKLFFFFCLKLSAVISKADYDIQIIILSKVVRNMYLQTMKSKN